MRNYDGASIAANYFVSSKESLGGKISFDNSGIHFKSHLLNIHQRDFVLEYNRIKKAEQYALGIAKTGMLITEKDGTGHVFAVNHRDDVISFLNNKASAKAAEVSIDVNAVSSPQATELQSSDSEVLPQSDSPRALFCSKCGRRFEDDDIFCPRCGNRR